MAIWITGIACLALGLVVGAAFGSRLGGGSARARELEEQLRRLRESDRDYRESVSEHFSATAELVRQMTENYRDVYQHLASGAQSLCSAEVASRLLPANTDAVLEGGRAETGELDALPPKDYAAKQDPSRKGALAEDFGLARPKPADDRGGGGQSS